MRLFLMLAFAAVLVLIAGAASRIIADDAEDVPQLEALSTGATAEYVSSCQTITTPGEYVLSNNITSTASYSSGCITISASNAVLDCNNFWIISNGTVGYTSGVYVQYSATNVTVKNCGLYGFNSEGNGIFETGTGGYLVNNRLVNNHIGIRLMSSNNISIIGNYFSQNNWAGMIFQAPNNRIMNNVFVNNVGLALTSQSSGASNTIISGNIIANNSAIGYNMQDGGYYNSIYNNYFGNNSGGNLGSIPPVEYNNTWNTTKTLGTNIIGGPYLGGNYWDNYSGADTDGDGLGNTGVPFNEDYLPLVPVARNYYVTNCTTINSPGAYVVANDISFPVLFNSQCININASNVTLDCQGHQFSGGGSSNLGNGDTVSMSSNYGTVKNCVMAHSGRGVAVRGNYNTIINNTIWDMQEGVNVGGNFHDNLVVNNTITNNTNGLGRAFTVWCCNAYNNRVTGNKLLNSTYGIDLGTWGPITGNFFYNNYIAGNLVNAHEAVGLNYWNITKTPGANIFGGHFIAGNYWSDYAGADTNGDGIGDTNLPYTSNSQIQNGGDYAPLTTSQSLVTSVSECANISTPGSYALSGDISASGTCITVSSNDTIINCGNHWITGNGSGYGVYLNNVRNVSVSDCNIRNFTHGAYFFQVTQSFLTGNYFTSNLGTSVVVQYSSFNTLQNNVVSAYGGTVGIYVQYSSNNAIKGNEVRGAADGIYLDTYANNGTVSGNRLLNDSTGIMLSANSYNTVTGNFISKDTGNCITGIRLAPFGNRNTISENNITLCSTGIYDTGSGYNAITGNRITNCPTYGLNLGSGYNQVYGNYFSNSNNAWAVNENYWSFGSLGNTWSDCANNSGYPPYYLVSGGPGVDQYPECLDVCIDGTPINQCSATNPLFCTARADLVNSCLDCGCPPGEYCTLDGLCQIIIWNEGCGGSKLPFRIPMDDSPSPT